MPVASPPPPPPPPPPQPQHPERPPPPPPAGVGTTLGAALGSGALVGTLAGLFDGGVRTLGIDPGLFLLRLGEQGLWTALTHGLPPAGDLPGLAGCTAGAALVYGTVGAVLLGALGLAAHPLVRRLDPARVRRRLLALAYGAWFFLEAYWWTRSEIYPGLSATSPQRLGAAALLLAACLGLGALIARLSPGAGPAVPRKPTRRWPLGIGLVWLVGGVYLGVDRGGGPGRGDPSPRSAGLPNVLLFVVDALRADALGCYGDPQVATPTMDRLAAEGVLFENAFAQAPFTWSSFGSLLTGKYPRRHGLVKMAPGYSLPPNVTLPLYLHRAPRADGRRLSETDYLGAAFMTGTLSHGSGLDRGFDVYFEALVGHELVHVHSRWSVFRSGLLPWLYKNKLHQRLDDALVARTAARWLRANGGKRWVALVHYYSTHTPYDPPRRYRDLYCDPDYAGPIRIFDRRVREAIEHGDWQPSAADVRQIRALYRAGVTQADAMIGELIAELEDLGCLEDTLVVVTSDHGESLGEHGLWEHNHMYQDNLRIPLILRYPRALPRGARVDAMVDSIDLVPTVLDLMQLAGLARAADLPPEADRPARLEAIDGTSLVPLVKGEAQAPRPYSFAENGRYHSIQDGRYKLIVRRGQLDDGAWGAMLAAPPERWGEAPFERPRLFDLEADPAEEDNLFVSAPAEHEPRILALRDALRSWSEGLPVRDDLVQGSDRDVEAQAALMRQLGYGGGVGEGEEEDGDGNEDEIEVEDEEPE